MSKTLIFCFLIFSIHCYSLYADEGFAWSQVTNDDWAISEDSSLGIHDAVIIFEKIIADDRQLIDNECYYSIYKRIKILSNEGRKFGDISIPLLDEEQKIENIKGRTISPDGKIIYLDNSKIFEKDFIVSKDIKIKQKFFYLPAVTNNCIIEYYINYELSNPLNQWIIEKDIYLKYGEFLWKFYRGSGLSVRSYSNYSDIITPNFIWQNIKGNFDTEMLPNIKDPIEVVCRVNDIPAYEPEPYTLPDIVYKANLRTFYGGKESPEAYWGERSKNIEKSQLKFTKENEGVKEIINAFQGLQTEYDKIEAVYKWIQKNIKNISYEYDDDEFDDNLNIEDLIENKYGTSTDIVRLFYDMLREMNIDAKIAYAVDKDENIFTHKAKYWQFDHSMVAIKNTKGDYQFYNPSLKFLPFGSMPWYNEGVTAFMIGDMESQFRYIPVSSASSNKSQISLNLNFDNNLNLIGTAIEILKGHPARTVRLKLIDSIEQEKKFYLRNRIENKFSNCELDSFKIENLDDIYMPLRIKYNIKLKYTPLLLGDQYLLRESFILYKPDLNFLGKTRNFPVVFDYAYENTESVSINVPESFEIFAIPNDMIYQNSTGAIIITTKKFEQSHLITVLKNTKIFKSVYPTSEYQELFQLFESQNVGKDLTIILKRKDN